MAGILLCDGAEVKSIKQIYPGNGYQAGYKDDDNVIWEDVFCFAVTDEVADGDRFSDIRPMVLDEHEKYEVISFAQEANNFIGVRKTPSNKGRLAPAQLKCYICKICKRRKDGF